jgi:hypothetical protein
MVPIRAQTVRDDLDPGVLERTNDPVGLWQVLSKITKDGKVLGVTNKD